MRILIKNGLLADGTLCEPSIKDILIEDDKVIQIDNEIAEDHLPYHIDKIIEARGRVVAPGFIDTHSHSDLSIALNPYNEIKIRQGVTTEILGQDGISMAPLPKKDIDAWRKINSSFNGDSDHINWEYENTEGYLNMLEDKGIGLNIGYLVAHGNLRLEALGLDDRDVSEAELESMGRILEREMRSGAIGLSSGLIYPPCSYASSKELIELCKVVARFDGIFVVHQRSEADNIIESMKEIINVGRESGVKIHFSHFKLCGKKNWRLLDRAFELLEEARSEGIEVSFDQYPYVAGSTSLGVILPPWVHSGGNDRLLERLKDRKLREKMISDIENGIEGWDNFMDFAGLDQIFITSVKNKESEKYIGKNLIELASIRGSDPYNATFDLIYEEENTVNMVDFYGLEEHIERIIKRPEHNVCTDGMISENPHPRLFGSFPRVLAKYVREEKILSLEEAVYKMTKKPSESFKISGRGEIKIGNYADIVIFDLETIRDCGTYVEPKKYPKGISHVIINGELVLEDNKYFKRLAGSVIRGD